MINKNELTLSQVFSSWSRSGWFAPFSSLAVQTFIKRVFTVLNFPNVRFACFFYKYQRSKAWFVGRFLTLIPQVVAEINNIVAIDTWSKCAICYHSASASAPAPASASAQRWLPAGGSAVHPLIGRPQPSVLPALSWGLNTGIVTRGLGRALP